MNALSRLNPLSVTRFGKRSLHAIIRPTRESNREVVDQTITYTSKHYYRMQHGYQKRFADKPRNLPIAKYGGRQMVTVLPGDGIGPEMCDHIKRIFRAAQVPVDFEDIPLDGVQATEDQDLENAIVSIERNGVALKGNIETKFTDESQISRNVALRTQLDLYANVVWCKSIPGVKGKYNDIDIVMIRENTEGEYSGIEHETVPGVVENIKVVTRHNIERIARYAFEYAVRYNRRKVTAIHKANIMKLGDGLFLRTCEDMAGHYHGIEFNNMIIDNAAMQLVSNPQQFDIALMPNLYGNILSNIACGLVGGPGLVSGANIGEKYAVFETGTRNTGTAIAGKNVANPVAFLRAAIDLLYYLGLDDYGNVIYQSVRQVLGERRIQTIDIGGTYSTSDFIENLEEEVGTRLIHL